MQGLGAKSFRLSTQRMTKDALSARLALSERTVFQKIFSKLFFNPFFFIKLKPLYLTFKDKLLYSNVQIIKQVPHDICMKNKDNIN